jgi:hypothetical protein
MPCRRVGGGFVTIGLSGSYSAVRHARRTGGGGDVTELSARVCWVYGGGHTLGDRERLPVEDHSIVAAQMLRPRNSYVAPSNSLDWNTSLPPVRDQRGC